MFLLECSELQVRAVEYLVIKPTLFFDLIQYSSPASLFPRQRPSSLNSTTLDKHTFAFKCVDNMCKSEPLRSFVQKSFIVICGVHSVLAR